MRSEARDVFKAQPNLVFSVSTLDVPSNVGTYVSYFWDATLESISKMRLGFRARRGTVKKRSIHVSM
jgi:hypothetical protein